MCFYIHPAHSEVKIAEEDIECYKILDSVVINYPIMISPYQKEVYFRKGGSSEYVIKEVKKFGFDETGNIHEGLHTHSTLETADNQRGWSERVYKAIIPKGTKYYYDPDKKEFVSLKLKIYRKPI